MTVSPAERERSITPLFWGSVGAIVAGIWAIVRSGTGIVPGAEWHFDAAAFWPNRPQSQDEWYLADSPLGLILSKALAIEDVQQFLLLHVVATLMALIALASWGFSVTGSAGRWQAVRISLLAPISAVLLAWIGMYDAFTAIAWAIALFSWSLGRRPLMIAAGIVLGFQHFEHAVLGLAALTLTRMALQSRLPDSLNRRSPLWLLPGLLIGKSGLLLIFSIQGVPLTSREDWISRYLYDWSATAANVFPLLLWSFFVGWWAVAILLTLDSTKRQRLFMSGAFVIGLLATLFSGDRPRVFILVLLPTVAVASVAFVRSTKQGSRENRFVEAIVWLAPPILFWGKDVANSNVIDLIVIGVKEISGG